MQRITPEEIRNRFTYPAPKVGQENKYNELRAHAKNLAFLIIDRTPASREQSTAITKLEEVIFWANAAIARREGPQDGDRKYEAIPCQYCGSVDHVRAVCGACECKM